MNFLEGEHYTVIHGKRYLTGRGYALARELGLDESVDALAEHFGGWPAIERAHAAAAEAERAAAEAAALEQACSEAREAASLQERKRLGEILSFGLERGLWEQAKTLAFIPDLSPEAAKIALAAMAQHTRPASRGLRAGETALGLVVDVGKPH